MHLSGPPSWDNFFKSIPRSAQVVVAEAQARHFREKLELWVPRKSRVRQSIKLMFDQINSHDQLHVGHNVGLCINLSIDFQYQVCLYFQWFYV